LTFLMSGEPFEVRGITIHPFLPYRDSRTAKVTVAGKGPPFTSGIFFLIICWCSTLVAVEFLLNLLLLWVFGVWGGGVCRSGLDSRDPDEPKPELDAAMSNLSPCRLMFDDPDELPLSEKGDDSLVNPLETDIFLLLQRLPSDPPIYFQL